MAQLPEPGLAKRNPATGDQSAAVLEWLGAAVPGFTLFRAHADGTLASVSDTWQAVTGLAPETCIGRPLADLVDPRDRVRVERLLERGAGASSGEARFSIPGSDGEGRLVMAMRGPDLSGDHGRDVVGIMRDVTAERAIERQLAAAYSYDMLTSIPNRTLFMDRLGEAVRAARASGEGLALLVCDIDRFRAVNETAGHRTADELLRIVARRLERQIRGSDMIGRIGADEFGIIQSGVRNQADTESLAERLTFVLAKPYRAEGIRMRASCSIGISMLAPEASAESMLTEAMSALTQAKRVGRGQIRFADPEAESEVRETHSLEDDLLQAIDEAGLTLHFQPVVDLATGRISGAEALLRWPHPERGFVEPSRFVPLAEATGAIRPLGAWVLDAACATLRRWDAAGLQNLTVAVNVSAAQFRDAGVYEAVTAALDRNHVDPRRLEIEITETAMLEDHAGGALPQLAALARRGVQIVIDDFGMGYGTLTYLRAFPVSKIKIDRAFIGAVMEDPRDAAIVRGVAALGSSLGLRVQPEGVETAEQLRFVQELGCTEVQGYLFSRALPEEDFVRFVSGWEQRRGSGASSAGDVPALVRRLVTGAPAAGAPGDSDRVAPDLDEVPRVTRAPGWERAFVLAASLVSLWTAAGAMLWLIV